MLLMTQTLDGGGLYMMVIHRLVLQGLFLLLHGVTQGTFAVLVWCLPLADWVYKTDLSRYASGKQNSWDINGLYLILGTTLLRVILLLTKVLNYLTQRIHGVIVTRYIGEKD